MKKLLFLLSVALFMISCDKESLGDSMDDIESFVDMRVNFSGDLLEIEEIPFSKGVDVNDLCLVLVQNRLKNSNAGSSWYAYGLFDNMDDINIRLSSLYLYGFKCFVIKGGKDIVYKNEKDNGDIIYYPIGFGGNSNNGIALKNEFVYSGEGFADESPSWKTICFYGGLENIDPYSSSSIDLDMVNISYRVKISVDNLNEGEVDVKLSSGNFSEEMNFTHGPEPYNVTMSLPLSFSGDYRFFDEYPFSFTLQAYYNNGDKSLLIANNNIEVKRKKGYSITIRVPDEAVEDFETKSISVSFEDEDVDEWKDIPL